MKYKTGEVSALSQYLANYWRLYSLTESNKCLNKRLWEERHGFLLNWSCADLVFTLRMLLEEPNEWCNKLYSAFIEFEKAFGSTDRQTLCRVLQHYDILDKPVRIIEALLQRHRTLREDKCGKTCYLQIMTGVKQGCVIYHYCYLSSLLTIFSGPTTDVESSQIIRDSGILILVAAALP